METATERLQFVIRLAQMDLGTLRPGDWLNLRDDLAAFVGLGNQGHALAGVGGILARGIERPLPQEFPEENFRALQVEIKDILLNVVVEHKSDDVARWVRAQRATHGSTVPRGIFIGAVYEIENVDTSWPAPPSVPGPGYNRLIVRGTTRECCLLVLLHLLAHERTHQIQRCPECRTIFYRIGKQQYCSRTCSNRTNVRTWRQREEGKEQEAERARQRYANKHPGAKVTRRPRKGKKGHVETPRES